jgi:dihydroxyacetone kinase
MAISTTVFCVPAPCCCILYVSVAIKTYHPKPTNLGLAAPRFTEPSVSAILLKSLWMRDDIVLHRLNNQLDSAIGDADYGTNMDRGFQAVLADQDIGTILRMTGVTLGSTVGGASGAEYCTFFIQMGVALANQLEFQLMDWAVALEAGLNGVVMRGKANEATRRWWTR